MAGNSTNEDLDDMAFLAFAAQHPHEAAAEDDDFPVDFEPTLKEIRDELQRATFPVPVIVDTREQAPFHFLKIDPWRVVPLITDVSLKTGDYTLRGFEDRLTVERKSTGDFLGSISAGRDRFEREFARMSELQCHPLGGFAVVVVEDELSNVLRYAAERTQMRTDSILGTIDAWSIRYGVHWRFCPGRRFSEIQTLKILYQFHRQEKSRLKAATTEIGCGIATRPPRPEQMFSPEAVATRSRIEAAIAEDKRKAGERHLANPQDVVP